MGKAGSGGDAVSIDIEKLIETANRYKWRNVKDEAPPKDRPFLGKDSDGIVDIIYQAESGRYDYKTHCDCCASFALWSVVAWTEIPRGEE